jgi:hypothetical protein
MDNHMKDIKNDALPSPKLDPRWALVSKTIELWGLEGMLLALSTKKGRRAC